MATSPQVVEAAGRVALRLLAVIAAGLRPVAAFIGAGGGHAQPLLWRPLVAAGAGTPLSTRSAPH